MSFYLRLEGKTRGTANVDTLTDKLNDRQFDPVAVGRALLVDPARAAKVRDGRLDELKPFTPEYMIGHSELAGEPFSLFDDLLRDLGILLFFGSHPFNDELIQFF